MSENATLPPDNTQAKNSPEIVWLQKWFEAIQHEQVKQFEQLRSINNKLTFFVVLAVLAIIVSIISMC